MSISAFARGKSVRLAGNHAALSAVPGGDERDSGLAAAGRAERTAMPPKSRGVFSTARILELLLRPDTGGTTVSRAFRRPQCADRPGLFHCGACSCARALTSTRKNSTLKITNDKAPAYGNRRCCFQSAGFFELYFARVRARSRHSRQISRHQNRETNSPTAAQVRALRRLGREGSAKSRARSLPARAPIVAISQRALSCRNGFISRSRGKVKRVARLIA